MNIEQIEKIKRLALIAMFSDDDLMDMFVLKGGNALDIVYQLANRASADLDFSIINEFKQEDLKIIEEKIKKVITKTFKTGGYEVFDVRFIQKPQKISPEVIDFWGGYQIDFKIIETERYGQLSSNLDSLRRQSTVVGEGQKRKIKIDISKFEYCYGKQEKEVDGYTIYVYTLEMIVLEKLRAICQQMPEYLKMVKASSGSGRARDFFDIYVVMEAYRIDLKKPENVELLRNIFAAKKVPLRLIGKIEKEREFHRQSFDAVKSTVRSTFQLKDFDFYFDYDINECRTLEPFWVK